MLGGLTFGSRKELEADNETKPGRKHKKNSKKVAVFVVDPCKWPWAHT
jgi:hypothetical protein